jgi:hypothetical protein
MANTSVVSSVSRLGKYEPFNLQVSRRQVTMHEPAYVWGYSTLIGATLLPVWDVNQAKPYLTTAAVMKVSSGSADDDSAGTGARTVLVSGLDQSYDSISEIVTLDGQTEVATTKAFLRVLSVTVLTVGSGGLNAGAIYVGTGTVTTGVPAVVHEIVPIGMNKSQSASYTVPAGYTAFFSRGGMTSHTTGSGHITGRLAASNQGSPFVTSAVTVFANTVVEYEFDYPLAFPEKTDIEARAIASSGTHAVSAYLQLILIKDNGQT